MNTEITKQSDDREVRGSILYDAECAAGVAGRNRSGRLLASRGFRWLPLLLLPSLAIAFSGDLEPWVFMWLLALAIYAGCKWLTWRHALAHGANASLRTQLLYLLLWPGMSLKEFAGVPPTTSRTFCFGTLSFFLADALASGEPLARAVCAFFAAFWTARLLVAVFVFDLRPYLTSGWRKVGYHATNLVFALLPVIYAWAAWNGGHL